MRPGPPHGHGKRHFSTRPFAHIFQLAISLLLAFLANGAKTQEKPPPPPPPRPPDIRSWMVNPNVAPSLRAEPSLSAVPSYSAAPSYSVVPSEHARVEAAKQRKAASDQIFEYQRVILKETTRVTVWDDGETYSVRALFTVQGESVGIRCISTVRAVVEAFLEYINRIFRNNSSIDRSLETIVADAHRDLRGHGFSDDDITLNYIAQFNETHVVQISRDQSGLMLAATLSSRKIITNVNVQ